MGSVADTDEFSQLPTGKRNMSKKLNAVDNSPIAVHKILNQAIAKLYINL